MLEASDRAELLASDSIIIDGHNDVAHWISKYKFDLGMDGSSFEKTNAELLWVIDWLMPKPAGDQLRTHTDLNRLTQGRLNAQLFSIFVDPDDFETELAAESKAFEIIETMQTQFARYPEQIRFACNVQQIRESVSDGHLAVLFGLEGGHALSDSNRLSDFFDRGVRYVTLTWSNANKWADSSAEMSRNPGLTNSGRELITEFNKLGMLIDVSHASDETFWDVISLSKAPIIASHSSARALVNRSRNLSDDMLAAIGKNGGIVMVNFGGIAIDPNKRNVGQILWDIIRNGRISATTIDMLVDHIEHIVTVAGIDHVGFGSDFDGTLFLPQGLEDVSGFPRLIQGLMDAGFTEPQIKKIAGENFLRVLEQAHALSDDPSRARCELPNS